jgi:beta-carotene/zeaxanthin 4-ketolase
MNKSQLTSQPIPSSLLLHADSQEIFICPEESQFYSLCLDRMVFNRQNFTSIVEFGAGDGISEIGLRGIAIALSIIITWATSLVLLLNAVDLAQSSLLWNLVLIFGQTFLYTGLFITAHDAMHGAILPKYPRINAAIGSLALLAYGLFSYERLLSAHIRHHYYPASDLDPDFHNGRSTGAITWYICFMQRYWSWWRFLGLIAIYCALYSLFHVPGNNLILFGMLPSILSSAQLFYFGTYLPHRLPQAGHVDAFHAQSTYYPLFWSFLTCYHFGYHYEHHRHPHLAWWQLPKAI